MDPNAPGLPLSFSRIENGIEARKSSSHFVYGEITTCVSNNIQVNMLPVPDIAIIATDDLLSSTVPGISYVWYFENNPIPNSNAQDYLVTAAGNYHVEVTRASGCVATSDQVYHGMAILEEMTIGSRNNSYFRIDES